MMSRWAKAFWPRGLVVCLIAALFATGASLPFWSRPRSGGWLEMRASADRPLHLQLFFDVGTGYSKEHSSIQTLPGGNSLTPVRFKLPEADLRQLRLDPGEKAGRVRLEAIRLHHHSGRILASFGAAEVTGGNEIASIVEEAGVLRIEMIPEAEDPQLVLRLDGPKRMRLTAYERVLKLAPTWLTTAVAALLLLALLHGLPARAFACLRGYATRRPCSLLVLVALAAVCIQCHPVIFAGKSFVSPDNAAFLLYDRFPTLPGYESGELEDGKGTDIAAILHANIHYPGLQRDALLEFGELPLWNRYLNCGLPMLGQGQSSFGGILNLIPLFGESSAGSWDFRFVLNRWLYAWGVGLAVWLLVRHIGAAALAAFCSVFIGFLAYRLNHMAQFSVESSPWILVGWLLLRDARDARTLSGALLLLGVATWEVMNSGTVKEAYMLIATLHGAGLLLILFSAESWRERLRRISAAACVGVAIVLLSAPLWMTFLDTLAQSLTHYDHALPRQAKPWEAIGFFEDLVVRQLRSNEVHAFPSSNLVALIGLGSAVLVVRTRAFGALLLASALPFGLAFGIVPAEWLKASSLLYRIQHFDNTFGCSLLVLTTVTAGFGLKALLTPEKGMAWRITAGSVAILAVLVVAFASSADPWTERPFFRAYALSLAVGALLVLMSPWLFRPGLRRTATGALLCGLVLLLWRHSQYVGTAFDPYVVNPKVRAEFRVTTPVIERLRALSNEPSRPAGLSYNLFGSYSEALRLETIYGVDPLRNPFFEELALRGGIHKLDWADPMHWNENDLRVLLPLHNLLNVRYYVAGKDEPPQSVQALQKLGSFDLELFESPEAWPRAFFTNRIARYRDVEDLLRLIRSPGGRRPFAAVQAQDNPGMVTTRPNSEDWTARTVSPASNYRHTNNTTEFTVEATGPGVTVLTESYYRDFRVTVNGEPASFFRVNHAFKGVHLPAAGTYRLAFSYWPRRLTLALALAGTGATLAILGAWLAWTGRIPGFPKALRP